MKYIILHILFISIITTNSSAQTIIAPDTICVGQTVNFDFNHPNKFTTYAWNIGNASITPISTFAVPIPNTATVGNTAFTVVDQATMVYDLDSNVYRAFVQSASTGYSNPSLQRLDFGTNPHSTPTVTNLGNPLNSFIVANYANMEGIEFTIDQNGIYHSFITNRGIVHLVFGNGLGNPPTQATRIYDNPTQMVMGMQLAIKNYNGEWYLFAGNAYGLNHIMRFDLGSNLNAIPATLTNVNLPAPTSGFAGFPCYFSIIKVNNNWHMTVVALTTASQLYRYDFGTNLANNNPTVTAVGSTGLNNIRGLNYVVSCDSFYQFAMTQGGSLFRLNYQNNINNMPTSQTFGAIYGTGQGMQMMKPYWYNDTLWALSSTYVNSNSHTVFRTPLIAGTPGTTLYNYYSPEVSYIFNTPGTYDITLYCDQADPAGPETYCSQIVVVDTNFNNSKTHTGICSDDSIVISSSISFGNSAYLWNVGDTTSSISVNQVGTYWVRCIYECGDVTDTFVVELLDSNIHNPISNKQLCEGDSIVLSSSYTVGSGNTYLWNTGATSASIRVSNIGMYWVSCKHKCGVITDTFFVESIENPIITIQPRDTSICTGESIQFTASGATNYRWEPSTFLNNSKIANPISLPEHDITYYVYGDNNFNCFGMDSITINILPLPNVIAEAENDVITCFKNDIQLNATGALRYEWNPKEYFNNPYISNPKVYPNTNTIFYVKGFDENNCSNIDSVLAIVAKEPIFFVPNAFSPNGDGLNDIFFPSIVCDFTLSFINVYNRFGELVFTSDNPDNGWNGLQNNQPCDVGTYFWYMEGVNDNGKKVIAKGDVTLLK